MSTEYRRGAGYRRIDSDAASVIMKKALTKSNKTKCKKISKILSCDYVDNGGVVFRCFGIIA